MSWQRRWQERFYDRSKGWVDGTAEFHALVANAIAPGSRILEIGAGPTNRTSRLLATLGETWGLDPDPAVLENEALNKAFVLEGPRFPFEDASFDAAVSDYVLEHVLDPRMHLREVARVLRPGSAYAVRTPNRRHYVALVASVTPHSFHRMIANRARALGPEAHDPYPTCYRINTRSEFLRLVAESGFTVDTFRMIEKEPAYGMIARPAFLAFMAYERLVNASSVFEGLRANILAVLRRD